MQSLRNFANFYSAQAAVDYGFKKNQCSRDLRKVVLLIYSLPSPFLTSWHNNTEQLIALF